jgi:HemY protein
MIRVVLFLVLVGLLALAGAWFADRPGDVTITWLGLQIETSVMFAVAAVAAIAVAAVMAWSLIRLVMRSPHNVRHALRERRRNRGHLAISKGLIAIGAGDVGAARKFAGEADQLAANEPLTLLLSAQTAQLSGDREAAERAFRRMAARPDTKVLGLRGLYVEAQRRADAHSARGFAEEAARAVPGLPWAGQAVLEFQCTGADWAGALATLDANMRGKSVDKAAYRRQRAVLLTAQALGLADTRPGEAKGLALEAVRLAPDLTPAAALAARLMIDNGDARKAARILEAAWRAQPHPDLADTYANLKSGDSARERLKRVQTLVRQRPDHVEASFAVARAALDAQEFAAARSALAPLQVAPTQRVAMLMAELEEIEREDEGRAREWMARALRAPRDPAWTADGFVSEHWMPVSPVTGRLDAFQWKVPLAEMVDDGRLIEEREFAAPSTTAPSPDDRASPLAGHEGTAAATPEVAPAPPVERTPVAVPLRPPPQRIDAVIPLVHAPDDPGPGGDVAPAAAGNGRRGLRSFFR